MTLPPDLRHRFVDLGILLVVGVSMAVGILAGLARIGYAAPAAVIERAALHGPILAAGVLGTLIALERAVAFTAVSGRRLHPAYLAPVASALGTAGVVIAGAVPWAQALLVAGAAGLLVVNLATLRRHPTLDIGTMALGVLLLLLGNAAWLAGRPIPLVSHWWVAFLVLTIVGERLELARIRPMGPRAVQAFGVITGVYLAAQAVMVVDADAGIRLSGAAMLALAAWLLRFDIGWFTIRRPGLPRFVAACLLLGYVWLAVGGLLALVHGLLWAGPTYDALLHALLLGFTFSMIFGHAPIIVPAILGVRVGFHPLAYGPLALLQVAVALRIAGDVALDNGLRMTGALLAALAILLYVPVVVLMVRAGRAAAPGRSRGARRGGAAPS